MRAALFVLSAIPVLAQFSGLATTDDGGQLYFSSPLELTGSTDTTAFAKIYRYDGTNFYLYARMARVPTGAPTPSYPGQYSIDSNYYALGSPFVSGNGSVVGYVASADCTGCGFERIDPAQTTFQFAGALGPLVLPEECEISTTGRYALCRFQFAGTTPDGLTFIDLSSMQQSLVTTFCYGTPHQMTSSGSALIVTFSPLALWSATSGIRTLPISLGVAPIARETCPMISTDGSWIVHVPITGLAIYDVATQTDTVLMPAPDGLSLLTMSNDARWILVEIYDSSGPQLAIVDSQRGSAKQLTFGTDGIQTAIISGDGSTVYAVAKSGKLLKIDTQSGINYSLLGNQAIVTSYDPPVPGSLNRILGSGFPSSPQVMLNGAAIPVVSSTATEIDAQIPWGTPPGTASLQVTAPTAIFQQMIQLPIQTIAPTLLGQPINQDFSGFITESSPAVGGEIVQLYFTGLGPVTPPVGDGKPAPASPLSVLTTPLQVTLPGQNPVQVQYQGLAPGLFGVYQVSVQLPATITGMSTTETLTGLIQLSLFVNGVNIVVWARPNQ